MFQTFQHQKFGKVRTLFIDGVLHFVGKDVATALGYKDTDKAIREHVDAEDKQIFKPADLAGLRTDAIFTIESPRGMIFINESGLYSLIFNSKLPEAKEFRHWVTSEVLPQIRKTGSFSFEKPPELPQILPLYYKGEKVLTTRQLAELFKVTESAVKHSYGRHKGEFEKGLDFYDLRGESFEIFRVENFNRSNENKAVTTVTTDAVTTVTRPVSFYIQGSVLKIWTKSGVFKLSKYIHTDNAKLIYISIAQGYFQVEPENLPVVKKQENLGASVYAFEMSNGTIKIGMSNNVPDRAKNIESETHLKVTNIYYRTVETRKKARAIETALHNYFASQCVQGEFFLIDFFEACTQIKIMVETPKSLMNPAEQIIKLLENSFAITDKVLRDEVIRRTFRLIVDSR